ncbi:MAG TPA: intradiol ring-cleavage dioxygenase [Longimicrobium sp.]
MIDDDAPVGRLLTRREALAALAAMGAGGMAFLSACGATADARTAAQPGMCVARPELTEGPYFVDERLNRRDIRSDPVTGAVKAGVPLELGFTVSRLSANRCTPLPNAVVDVWHTDALGVYSDVRDPGFETTGQKWLRGSQLTDAAGVAGFTTIYPGWYSGRAVHIHFKIRGTAASGRAFDFTSQLFFDEDVTDAVHARPPYAARGRRTRMNSGDGIFRQGGAQLLLTPARTADGYAAPFSIGLQDV